jgi:hypothetical protein
MGHSAMEQEGYARDTTRPTTTSTKMARQGEENRRRTNKSRNASKKILPPYKIGGH